MNWILSTPARPHPSTQEERGAAPASDNARANAFANRSVSKHLRVRLESEGVTEFGQLQLASPSVRRILSPAETNNDKNRLARRLAKYKMTEVKVRGDGSCQFRALSYQLFGDESGHSGVRKAVLKRLKSHRCVAACRAAGIMRIQKRHAVTLTLHQILIFLPILSRSTYEPYMVDGFTAYVKKMEKNGTWGDHLTLKAAADAYGVRIFVVTSFEDEASAL